MLPCFTGQDRLLGKQYKMDYGLLFLRLKARFSRASAVILILNGKAVPLKGIVPSSILAAFSDLSATYSIDKAIITVRKSGGSTSLLFSGPVPGAARQRFRNIWFSFPERKMTGV